MNSNDFDRMTARFANTTSRRQALKLMAGGILGGAAMATGIKGATAQPAQGTGLPITGTVTENTGALDLLAGDTVSGVLSGLTATLDRATGVIDIAGTFTGGIGTALEGLTSTVTATVEDLFGSEEACDILFLELAPLYLDVLGLVVELPNPLVINIDAVPGAGNLLGNLLCAVTGLLDNPSGNLNGVTNLLNRIFSILG